MRPLQVTHARLRSVTGVIIGLYFTLHPSDHALGLISVDAQEVTRPYVLAGMTSRCAACPEPCHTLCENFAGAVRGRNVA